MVAHHQNGLTLTLDVQKFPYRKPFRISGHVFTETSVLVAQLSDGEHTGRGEGAGVYYLGDDIDHMVAEAQQAKTAVEACRNREELQQVLPPGGARNAIDCAFWDLEAKQQGQPAWKLAGLGSLKPLPSALTLGADDPAVMAEAALALNPDAPIKVKLTGEVELDKARLKAIRAARETAWIGVDANQGYSADSLRELVPALLENRIALLEQPLRRGAEGDLDGFKRPLPFVADESALSLVDTASLVGRYDIVNIKLDKCGGLTEGLAIARQARQLGLGVMVGNMMGTSLSMAPSYVLGQFCDVVDLDGPTFLARDRDPGVTYADGLIHCPRGIWGW
ncbi:dipeptide epimerase [Altererythrobacter sp. SALINAS58]|uniref:dipeptide epimerase n=1 Tax=Alteripontixanthobacter muriae TaxID=2705546 RepID=UPI0015751AC6|nr:dipeptide epimerase [Alteripontixanthobacter muriae]NTZ43274.1 dipeptide epimerase [Alteripontixanthobacter muriae]